MEGLGVLDQIKKCCPAFEETGRPQDASILKEIFPDKKRVTSS
jgi:hypothetical protein